MTFRSFLSLWGLYRYRRLVMGNRPAKLQEAGLTLRRDKYEIGKQDVEWFGHRFSAQGMRADPGKAKITKE